MAGNGQKERLAVVAYTNRQQRRLPLDEELSRGRCPELAAERREPYFSNWESGPATRVVSADAAGQWKLRGRYHSPRGFSVVKTATELKKIVPKVLITDLDQVILIFLVLRVVEEVFDSG